MTSYNPLPLIKNALISCQKRGDLPAFTLAGNRRFRQVGSRPRGSEKGAGTHALEVRFPIRRAAISLFGLNRRNFQLCKILPFSQGAITYFTGSCVTWLCLTSKRRGLIPWIPLRRSDADVFDFPTHRGCPGKALGQTLFRERRERGSSVPNRLHGQDENRERGCLECEERSSSYSVATTDGTSDSRRRPAPLPPTRETGLILRVGLAPARLFARFPCCSPYDPSPPAPHRCEG